MVVSSAELGRLFDGIKEVSNAVKQQGESINKMAEELSKCRQDTAELKEEIASLKEDEEQFMEAGHSGPLPKGVKEDVRNLHNQQDDDHQYRGREKIDTPHNCAVRHFLAQTLLKEPNYGYDKATIKRAATRYFETKRQHYLDSLPERKEMSEKKQKDKALTSRRRREFAASVNKPFVFGVYRPLENFLLRLAKMYLQLNKYNKVLHWFQEQEGHFLVALGADGAPFGKDETATSFVVSFLNVLDGIQSCDNNFLLMGANCDETHELMFAYSEHVFDEMEKIEDKTYEVEDYMCGFTCTCIHHHYYYYYSYYCYCYCYYCYCYYYYSYYCYCYCYYCYCYCYYYYSYYYYSYYCYCYCYCYYCYCYYYYSYYYYSYYYYSYYC
ncbi:hypothetical protein QZH41_000273 [Actinostola sp. cb2023]|nr:hypothetical protein QZH41_000273 [Actinostola sp. cb2023]